MGARNSQPPRPASQGGLSLQGMPLSFSRFMQRLGWGGGGENAPVLIPKAHQGPHLGEEMLGA